MKAQLPEATFIGFTGTPLLKVDKEKQRKSSVVTFIVICLLKLSMMGSFLTCLMRHVM